VVKLDNVSGTYRALHCRGLIDLVLSLPSTPFKFRPIFEQTNISVMDIGPIARKLSSLRLIKKASHEWDGNTWTTTDKHNSMVEYIKKKKAEKARS
jgi:hypothetical protein